MEPSLELIANEDLPDKGDHVCLTGANDLIYVRSGHEPCVINSYLAYQVDTNAKR